MIAAALLAVAFPVFGQTPEPKADSAPSTQPQTPRTEPDPLTHGERRAKLFQTVHARQAEIQFRYARELRGSGYLGRAKTEFQTFLLIYRDHPKVLDAILELAEIAVKEGDPEEAAAYFLRAFTQSPWDERGAAGAIRAARILADLGELDRSSSILDEVIGKWPGSRLARMAQVEKDSMKLVPGGEQVSGKTKENAPREAENREKNRSQTQKEGDKDSGRESMGEGVGEN